MSQLTVSEEPVRAYRGKIDVSGAYPTTQVSGLAVGNIVVGDGVGREVGDVDPGAGVATGGQTARAFQGTDLFLGVAPSDPSQLVALPGETFGQYTAAESFPIVRKGRVWVVTADVVDDLSKAVFIRNANAGGSPPAEQLGAFRATTVADYVDLSALAAVAWVAGVTIGGVNFGLLELNLP